MLVGMSQNVAADMRNTEHSELLLYPNPIRRPSQNLATFLPLRGIWLDRSLQYCTTTYPKLVADRIISGYGEPLAWDPSMTWFRQV
jgi:hypothetical protein